MKKYVIGKLDENIYTFLKNINEELKKQILEFKPSDTRVSLGWPAKVWNIKEWEKHEVRCEEGRNIQYFPVNTVKEALKETQLYELNKKFKAFEHFKNTFGIISQLHKTKDQASLSKLNLINGCGLLGGEIDTLNVQGYEKFEEYSVSTYKGIAIEYRSYGSMLNLHFDMNGDFVNRDYNLDMHNYVREDISPKVVLNKFKELILKIKNLKRSNNIYFNDDFRYKPYYTRKDNFYEIEFGIDAVPAYGQDKYRNDGRGETVYKKPTKYEETSSEQLYEDILAQIDIDVLNLFA
jgi:hypothetical protein